MTVERRVADPYEFRLTRRRTRGVAQSCFLRTPSMHYHEETFQAFQSDFASAVLSVAATGSMSLNSAPLLPSDDAVSWPPCCSTIMQEMASPNPIPCDFVVTNVSNTLSRFFGSIPGPESCTERTIPLSLPYPQRPTSVRCVVHRFDCITNQVSDHFLQLPFSATDNRRSRGQLLGDRDCRGNCEIFSAAAPLRLSGKRLGQTRWSTS
jgi:hypothetical protein